MTGPAVAPSCRHLLATRGGTFGCTLPSGHPGSDHTDEDLLDPEGVPATWSCTCRPVPGAAVTVCRTFRFPDYPQDGQGSETG